MKKPRTKITPRKKNYKKLPYNRGAIGPGMAFALVALLVVVSGGTLMIGNIVPNGKAPATGQPVIIQPGKNEPPRSNLQLNYFAGITLTPSPIPTFDVPKAPETPKRDDSSKPPDDGSSKPPADSNNPPADKPGFW